MTGLLQLEVNYKFATQDSESDVSFQTITDQNALG